MNCEAYTELISGALDGVLTPEEPGNAGYPFGAVPPMPDPDD